MRRLRSYLPTPFSDRRSDDNAGFREILALNLSHVLHEPSTSQTVRGAVEAALRHQAALRHLNHTRLPLAVEDPVPDGAMLLLTAGIGIPKQFTERVRDARPGLMLSRVDVPVGEGIPVSLFRAPAVLNLPVTTKTVAVGALVRRPGGGDADMRVSGPYRWPDQTAQVLASVENLIRDFADQWLPPTPLWPRPFEDEHPEEIAETPFGPRSGPS